MENRTIITVFLTLKKPEKKIEHNGEHGIAALVQGTLT